MWKGGVWEVREMDCVRHGDASLIICFKKGLVTQLSAPSGCVSATDAALPHVMPLLGQATSSD